MLLSLVGRSWEWLRLMMHITKRRRWLPGEAWDSIFSEWKLDQMLQQPKMEIIQSQDYQLIEWTQKCEYVPPPTTPHTCSKPPNLIRMDFILKYFLCTLVLDLVLWDNFHSFYCWQWWHISSEAHTSGRQRASAVSQKLLPCPKNFCCVPKTFCKQTQTINSHPLIYSSCWKKTHIKLSSKKQSL